MACAFGARTRVADATRTSLQRETSKKSFFPVPIPRRNTADAPAAAPPSPQAMATEPTHEAGGAAPGMQVPS